MKLYVARHGHTNYNELGLCNSDPKIDVHLIDAGIEQANNLADRLKNSYIEQIFVSELRRTEQTASIVNQYHNAPVVVDARLNDIRFGSRFEGRHYSEYRAALEKTDNKFTARIDGCESIIDVRARTQEFLDDISAEDYKSVLVVTSGGVMQAMYAIIENLSIEEAWSFRPDNGTCVELELN